ncbi:MAG: hypothetical protein KTR35_24150 [Gammaproteobacteria bacterium]|nr:hypothetical protein [Gammaproteobacteria bacterium]
MPNQPGHAQQKFPDEVIVALHEANITATCMPVQIDQGQWQAAFFYVLAPDAPCLSGGQLSGGPFSVVLDADLHEHENGTMIEIGMEIMTPIESSHGVMLFLTGHSSSHFEALNMLSTQQDIPLFIGDQYCSTLLQQRIPVNESFRLGISGLINEAVTRDAVIRMTDRYDPDAVFADTLAKRQMT